MAAAAGCTQVPELDQAISDGLRDARYPALIPLDDDIFAGQDPGAEAEDIEANLTNRRDRLKSRAAGMTAPVIDPVTRKRMQAGVGR